MARKFSFRFESILNLREKEEENKKADLGVAAKALRQEEEHLTHLLQQKIKINEEIKKRSQSKLQIKDLQHFSSKIEFIDELINRQKQSVNKCQNQVDHCRRQLVEAKKQVKVFDLLKEKDKEEYNYLQLKDEEMFIDQLVSYKIASK
ncbi:flagellar export protein FliJ [Alkaliphilus transvaalensis]|uniref:flagellar export protein FliJ n=1 Tax=Alkaliphilus transvaalensis TaxID=114628 RepID=UPI000479BCC7|nr:flagellar export protein FliJ [Alkaliphilus transvaalensis]